MTPKAIAAGTALDGYSDVISKSLYLTIYAPRLEGTVVGVMVQEGRVEWNASSVLIFDQADWSVKRSSDA